MLPVIEACKFFIFESINSFSNVGCRRCIITNNFFDPAITDMTTLYAPQRPLGRGKDGNARTRIIGTNRIDNGISTKTTNARSSKMARNRGRQIGIVQSSLQKLPTGLSCLCHILKSSPLGSFPFGRIVRHGFDSISTHLISYFFIITQGNFMAAELQFCVAFSRICYSFEQTRVKEYCISIGRAPNGLSST